MDMTETQMIDTLTAAADIVDRPEMALTFWALIETVVAGADPAVVDLMFTMATDDLVQRRRKGEPTNLRAAMLLAAQAAVGWEALTSPPATTNSYPFHRP